MQSKVWDDAFEEICAKGDMEAVKKFISGRKSNLSRGLNVACEHGRKDIAKLMMKL